MASADKFIEGIDKLKDAEGYPLWKFQLEIHLEAADLLDAVIVAPMAAQEIDATWKKKDAKSKRTIVSTLDKQILIHVVICKNSNEMWTKLKNIFECDSEQNKCTLMQEFFKYKKNDNVDIAVLITELKNIAFKLNTLGEQISDEMIITKILSVLPENYRYFSSAWDSTPTGEKTLTNLTARL